MNLKIIIIVKKKTCLWKKIALHNGMLKTLPPSPQICVTLRNEKRHPPSLPKHYVTLEWSL